MTEQEFTTQIWRMYDRIMTAGGVEGKVLGVAFNTKSVRAYISGAPEWIRCELIETHITCKGGDTDGDAIIEALHNKVLDQAYEIERLKRQKRELEEDADKYHLKGLLSCIRELHDGLNERKNKIELINGALAKIESITAKLDTE